MDNFLFDRDSDKNKVFYTIAEQLDKHGFKVVSKDENRPWGGFFVIDESQAAEFITAYFPHLNIADFKEGQKLSPKILVVGPDKRLSWQYHFRRAEIWRVLSGIVGIKTSMTDEEGELKSLEPGTVVNLAQGQRHRLIGLDEWGVLAEIWQHVDANNPSDESDIVRVQDDFGR